MRALFASALLLLAAPAMAAGLDSPTPAPGAVPTPPPLRSVAIYVWGDDGASSAVAGRVADAFAKRAVSDGWRPMQDPRIPDLLERAPADLVITADALALARASWKEGQELNGRLRLDAAQEALLKARSSLLEASSSPDYNGLRQVHLYLGIVALNQGQPDVAAGQFRSLAFLAPALTLNRDLFPPSVQEALANAKKSVLAGAKGSLRIEVDGTKSASLFLDESPRGLAPKVLTDLPEGEHYLEVRAPGCTPQLLAVNVLPAIESQTIVIMRGSGPSLRSSWGKLDAETGGGALARIVEADRLILGSARSTVTGVNPVTLRAASFDATLGKRMHYGEVSGTRELSGADTRLQKLSQQLFRATPANSAEGGASYAALVATRDRFLDRDSTLLTLEAGTAYMDHIFNAHASFVPSTRDAGGEDYGFSRYLENRAIIHARYGLREGVALVLDVPFLTKEMTYQYDDGNGNGTQRVKRTASGLGDMILGADIRLPQYESPLLAMLYVSARVKMPTGQSTTPDYFRHYTKLIMGSGQWDIYGGFGGLFARGDARIGFDAGYNARLPDRLNYAKDDGEPGFLNIGDEEHLKLNGSDQILRWLAPEVGLDLTHRHATQHFQDPVTHDGTKAREMYLLNMSAAARVQLSERSEAGAVFEHPVWGKITKTYFPLDITGPRFYAYYGLRF